MTDPLSELPPMPTPTAGIGTPAPAAPAAPDPVAPAATPAPTSGAQLDNHNTPWDHTQHVHPPRLTKAGRWERLRGNAAVRAQGRPMTLFGKIADAVAPPPPPPPQPAAASASFLAPEPPPPAVDAIAAPEPVERPREAYTATAQSLTDAMFGLARMLFGPSCEPTSDEHKAWRDQWREALHSWQVVPFGPVIGLVVLAIGSIAKRMHLPDVRERGTKLWRFLTRQPAPAAYGPPPVQPTAATPAAAPPDASVYRASAPTLTRPMASTSGVYG